ncbi:MAG: hypothetical protein IJE26_02470, partial [Oscillospiraceae bacterium]|nr:hypothetical protein [Oscillospiraceae bacterium]
MENRENNTELIKLLIISTLVFALLLGGTLLLGSRLPELRESRMEKAIAAENYAQARRIAGRIREEETARPWLQRCDYLEARQLMTAGDHSGAAALLSALGNYEDSAVLLQDCRYALAQEAMEQSRWAEAISLLESLGGRDVLAELDECRYGLAGQLAEAGDDTAAAALYSLLGEYRDSRSRLGQLAMRITGIDDAGMAANALSGLSAEELAQQDALAARRAELPQDILAVGHRHTVALRSSGSVLACGDNSFGQCDVAGWADITAVDAGAYHTVGLRADGTVVTTGRDSEGQRDTADWTDIVEIAAGDYATFGLRSDGTVLCTGHNDYPAVSGWSGITHISGGSYALGALRGSTAFISHEGARSEELTGLVDIVLNSGYAVGLRSTGTVISPGFELDWKQVTALSCSGTG